MAQTPVSLKTLLSTLPQRGRVDWIGVRPERRAPVNVVEAVEAQPGHGLTGDRYRGGHSRKREVTLIQAEHLPAIASMLGLKEVDPALLRRNIAVAGLNLLALKDRRFRIGEAELEMTGLCHPCSRMEEALGPGGYNAVRGHGGITARILRGGVIRLGDPVEVLEDV
jgi:MOSC domain-containing protein YiiM